MQLTVFADLTVAVEAGMILAALLFVSRVAATTTVSQVTEDYVEDGRVHILQDKDIPYYATIFRIHGHIAYLNYLGPFVQQRLFPREFAIALQKSMARKLSPIKTLNRLAAADLGQLL